MARSIVLSNGELAVCLSTCGHVTDVYYPHVGHENHVRGHYIHRVGVWVEGTLRWLCDPGWDISITCENGALASSIVARHVELGIELHCSDIVVHDTSVLIRRIRVTNTAQCPREIKLYFAHQFEIGKTHGGDTALYDPRSHSIIHYKARRAFLIMATLDGQEFNDYATGRANYDHHEGTHKDAEDGVLSQNPIEHGPADSVIGLYASYGSGQSRTCQYAMIAARSIDDAREVAHSLRSRTLSHVLSSSRAYWKAWTEAMTPNSSKLTEHHMHTYRASLLYTRAAVDRDGGILASLDFDMLEWGYDTYAYVWPRDAGYAALFLSSAGDTTSVKRFLKFCTRVISKEGYFLQKYWPDGSLGSSWHPWFKDGKEQLPIQEDETAIVVIALAQYIEQTNDIEFLKSVYETLVVSPADFMSSYRDPITHMPLPSYDLWERKRGTSTYTSACVYGALCAASTLAAKVEDDSRAQWYATIAHEVQEAIIQYMWDESLGAFVNMFTIQNGTITFDRTLDVSSVYGVAQFDVLPLSDERIQKAWNTTLNVLTKNISVGGIARFDGDDYFWIDHNTPGNPWVITTLWYAHYRARTAQTPEDLAFVQNTFQWCVEHAQASNVLSEQINPATGEQIGSTPLTWSHAQYGIVIQEYLRACKRIGL